MKTIVIKEASSVSTGVDNRNRKYVEWIWQGGNIDEIKDMVSDSFNIDFRFKIENANNEPLEARLQTELTIEQTNRTLRKSWYTQLISAIIESDSQNRLSWGWWGHRFNPKLVQKIILRVTNKFNPVIDHYADGVIPADAHMGFIKEITQTQIDLSPTADAELKSFPPPVRNQNFGIAPVIAVKNGAQAANAVINFDLSAINSVSSAILELNVLSAAASPELDVFLVSENWTENGVTWNHCDNISGISWRTAGGTCNPASVLASGPVPVPGPGKIQLDVTSYVQNILSGTQNYGLLIKNVSAVTNSSTEITSKEGVTVPERPVLKILT